MIDGLTVVYDEHCALCRRCRHWLELQRALVPLHFLAAGSPQAQELYGELPWLGSDLVVVSTTGDAWVGPAAFLMCLWATDEYRLWSYRLSGRTLAPMAERFFHTVSKQRGRIGKRFGDPECPDGSCKHRGAPAGLSTFAPPRAPTSAAPNPCSPSPRPPVPAGPAALDSELEPTGQPRTGHGIPTVYDPPSGQWQPPQFPSSNSPEEPTAKSRTPEESR